MTSGSARVGSGTPAGRAARLAGRLRRLASAEGLRFLRALGLLLEVDLRLRLTGFARIQSALRLPAYAAGAARQRDPLPSQAYEMARALRQAARFVPRARCLHRALALSLWLRRRGVVADLHIGVRSSGETIEGHAWVEWNGVPLDEDRSICDGFDRLVDTR